jgi:hypothetical protein
MNFTRFGIVLFSAAALAGLCYTVDGYGVVKHVISQLGAQNTPNNFIMIAGFIALGAGLITDGLRRFSMPLIPFIFFGFFMALAGLLAHKPLAPAVPFNNMAHQAHGILASLAGISITVGLLWQAVRAARLCSRAVAVALAVLCLVLPLCMLFFQEFQGLIQRLMYLMIFTWLWCWYPIGLATKREDE